MHCSLAIVWLPLFVCHMRAIDQNEGGQWGDGGEGRERCCEINTKRLSVPGVERWEMKVLVVREKVLQG